MSSFNPNCRYNYEGISIILNLWEQFGTVKYNGIEEGRRSAIDALVEIHRYYVGMIGIPVTRDIQIRADYGPHMLPKRYDYGIAYKMRFIVCIKDTEVADAKDIVLRDDGFAIVCDNVTFLFDVDRKMLTKHEKGEKKNGGNRKKAKRDLAVNEEEMREPEVQGLPPLREEGHPRVSRVARL